MKLLRKALFALFVALASSATAAEQVRIVYCYDGDTVRTSRGEIIRIACIDTPELQGKHAHPLRARLAKGYLMRLVGGKWVTVQRVDRDKYGRTVAELLLGNLNVGRQMVASGHAKIFRRFAYHCAWTKS